MQKPLQTLFSLQPKPRGCHLVTSEILSHLPELPDCGILNLFVMHTSCALSINENFDASVRSDLSRSLDRLFPDDVRLYEHVDEGADDMPSHCKSVVVGASLTIPIANHSLCLGTWQGIYLCEFRNHGGSRRVVATILW